MAKAIRTITKPVVTVRTSNRVPLANGSAAMMPVNGAPVAIARPATCKEDRWVSHSFKVAPFDDADQTWCTIGFDFTDVSYGQLMAAVISPIVIRIQGKCRNRDLAKFAAKHKEFNGKVQRVAELLNGTRVRLTPQKRATKIVAKMSAEDRKALLAELTASMK